MIEVEAMQLARLLDFHQVSSYGGLNRLKLNYERRHFGLCFTAMCKFCFEILQLS